MNHNALYVGSFDPVTYGHLDIIRRACKMFDYVEVAVGDNPAKKYMFSFNERVAMLEQGLNLIRKDMSGVIGLARSPIRTLTADHARKYGFDVIIKGARTTQDFDYEKLLHEVSATQQRNVETVLLFCSPELSHVSSTAVKELSKYHGLIHKYVPLHVKAAIDGKNGRRIVGLAGTIGSGKSYLTHHPGIQNAQVINLDLIGHEVLEGKLPICEETREKLTKEFGTCARKQLGEIVFADKSRMAKLNEIMREPMLTLLRDKLAEAGNTVLLEGALLIEMDWLFLCNNQVILVKTPSEPEHHRRLAARGYSDEEIKRRLSSQYTFEEKKNILEQKIKNDGVGSCYIYDSENPESFIGAIDFLWKK